MPTINQASLERSLDRQLGWISAADGKIGPVLALDTAMLGALAALAPAPGDWTWWVAFLVAATLLGLGVSIVSLYFAAFPRTKGPAGSLVYFGGISERGEEGFLEEIFSVSRSSYQQDLAAQCYRNAQIAGEKFSCIKWATGAMLLTLLPWALAIYFIYAAGNV